MKTIMLVCSAGMSTSLLVTKMEGAAKDKGIEAKIFAVSEAEAKLHYDNVNVVLLGPQVKFLLKKIQSAVEGKNVPVEVINTIDYGRMNGENVLMTALDLIG